jgi:hypothetical protein
MKNKLLLQPILTAFALVSLFTITAQAVVFDITVANPDSCDQFFPTGCFAGHGLFLPGLDPAILAPGCGDSSHPDSQGTDGYKFVFTSGTFVENADGTAVLTASLISTVPSHPGYGFNIDLKLVGKTNDPSGGMGPNLELSNSCYVPPTGPVGGGPVNPATWHFYSNFDVAEATLTGTGKYDGAVLHIVPFMHYFQVGDGASGKNVLPGASGWFNWTVVSQPKDTTIILRSSDQAQRNGDFNFNTSPHRPALGQIGDTVYCDLNGNGMQDSGEPGIAGVKVDLFANCTGQAIDSQITDSNGNYLFTDLAAGQYCVVVDQSTVPLDCSVPKCATSFTVNLQEGQSFLDADFCFTPPCPACVNPDLGLGAAAGCTVLELGTGSVSVTGPAGGILGDVCIAPNGSLSMSGDEYVTGTIKLGPGAKFSNSSHGNVVVMNNVNLSAQIAAANNRASSAAALPPTQTFSTLDGKNVTTITGVAGTNVISVNNINLSGKQIKLTGPVGAKFIVNVTGKMNLTGGGNGPQIRAAGGVQPKDILFNIIGSGSDVAFSGGGGGTGCCQAIVDGTLLAPQRNINLAPGLVNGEVISGKNISIVSGSSVRCPVCQ